MTEKLATKEEFLRDSICVAFKRKEDEMESKETAEPWKRGRSNFHQLHGKIVTGIQPTTVNLAAMIAEALIKGEAYEQPTIITGTVGMDDDMIGPSKFDYTN